MYLMVRDPLGPDRSGPNLSWDGPMGVGLGPVSVRSSIRKTGPIWIPDYSASLRATLSVID